MTSVEPDGGTHPERPLHPHGPRVVAFDVNETLSDTSALGTVFEEVGVPARVAPLWFAQVLRDGFAIALAGQNVPFSDVARACLPRAITDRPAEERKAAEERIIGAFAQLPLHPDVMPGLRRLADSGRRLVTLSNGSAEVARHLFESAGVTDMISTFLSVADAPVWKPGAAAYRWAAEQCEVAIGELMLVAVHPWDIHGAAAAGARTAWINREGDPYPATFTPADVEVRSLADLAAALHLLRLPGAARSRLTG